MTYLKYTQLALGSVFLFAFLGTGFYMYTNFPALYAEDEGVRMMYRSTHIYLLFSCLLNLVIGVFFSATGAGWIRKGQLVARLALMIMPAAFLVAFFYEPPIYAEHRPITYLAVIACFGAVMALVALHYIAPLLRALRKVFNAQRKPSIRIAKQEDMPRLEEVRAAAFAPVFASFRQLLGERIYTIAQQHEDEAQAGLLTSLIEDASVWKLYVAEIDGEIAGFVSVSFDTEKGIGEIGLNAVHPFFSGRGIGAFMYDFVLQEMKHANMKVATVATGADPGHAPARRAYAKAGFNVSVPSVWFCKQL